MGLPIAQAHGLKNNVYFNNELQQANARLRGMQETLGRLQSDLQGTSMAMQRVEIMRQEIDSLSARFKTLQEQMGSGEAVAPDATPAAAASTPPVTTTTVTTVTEAVTQPATVPAETKGSLATPPEAAVPAAAAEAATATATETPKVDEAKGQIAKPILDEKPAAKKAEAKDDKKAQSAPAYASDAKGLVGVRFGTHPDRMRIVLDVAGDATFTTSLDNAEKLLTVELPKATCAASTDGFKGNGLVASYTAQASGDGCVVAFVLKAGTKIIESKTMKADAGKPTRLVIDLAK